MASVALVISACAGSALTTAPDHVETDELAVTSAPTAGSTQTAAIAPTSTAPELSSTSPTSTIMATPQTFAYAVVAEEREHRLAVLDPADPCVSQENPLQPLSVVRHRASCRSSQLDCPRLGRIRHPPGGRGDLSGRHCHKGGHDRCCRRRAPRRQVLGGPMTCSTSPTRMESVC